MSIGPLHQCIHRLHQLLIIVSFIAKALPVLEISLIVVLCFHIAVGLRLMRNFQAASTSQSEMWTNQLGAFPAGALLLLGSTL